MTGTIDFSDLGASGPGTTSKVSVRVARELANYLSDNDFPDGTKLPTETELASRFGVGRVTLREALRLLEMRGVITIRVGRGGGPVVRRPVSTDLADSLALLLQFQKATLGDVIEARLVLEPAAARRAAELVTPELLAELRDSVVKMSENPDARTFTHENSRFHSLIADTLQNPVITVFVDSVKHVHEGRPFGSEYGAKDIQSIARAHRSIIRALATKDPDKAEAAMRKHLAETRTYWSKRYSEYYNQPVRWINRD